MLISMYIYVLGVIDWDWMSTAPLPAIIQHPWFIADIPCWSNNGVTEGEERFAEDSFFLENAIKKRQLALHLPPTVSTLLTNSRERFFFQSAFHFRYIHERFVNMHCAWSIENIEAASSQLGIVLRLYPQFEGLKGVQRVKDLMEGKGEFIQNG